jgi:hypothetical protein
VTLYVCTGLYSEGNSDDDFLIPLLNRLLDDLLRRHFPSQHTLADTIRLPDLLHIGSGRAHRIAATILEHWSTCTLFVVHSDGKSEPAREAAQHIAPAIALSQEKWRNDARTAALPLAIASCVPVREMEAWLSADPAVFERLGVRDVELPVDPERVTDPKQCFRGLLRQHRRGDLHRHPPFEFFGENVDLAALRTLAAFRSFEGELLTALHLLAPRGL